MDWLTKKIKPPSKTYYKKALEKQTILTKPLGSLGVLEEIAAKIAAMQNTESPDLDKIWVSIFAADHGVADESVSAFPQIVTTEMVKNFINNGAAVNVLAGFVAADFEVVDVGLLKNTEISGVVIERAGNGTKNFAKQMAMTESQLQAALIAGKSAVLRAEKTQAKLFVGGEMGIANTTSATALAVAVTGLSAMQLTGAGTGIGSEAIEHKTKIIQRAILKHDNFLITPLKILQYLGGFEIAALVGAYIFAAQQGLPVLIDGFIATVAALIAVKISPDTQNWFLYAHCSQEKGHQLVLDYLNVKPLLDLNMRLGEASGALVAVPLLQMACKLHNEMATFEQAEVSRL